MYDIHLATFPRFPPRARAHTHTQTHKTHTHTLTHIHNSKPTQTYNHASTHTHLIGAHGVGARLDQARHCVRVAVFRCLEQCFLVVGRRR